MPVENDSDADINRYEIHIKKLFSTTGKIDLKIV